MWWGKKTPFLKCSSNKINVFGLVSNFEIKVWQKKGGKYTSNT